MKRRFFWGTIAVWALRRHYAREVRPFAEARGTGRDAVRAAAHKALDRVFRQAWPAQRGEGD